MNNEAVERIIKAYDIRGLVDGELTEDFAFSAGVAFARFLELQREPATVVIGEDMRPSSPDLATAFSDGVTSQSFDVMRIGLASTDQLYFASGSLNLPGAMFTASHNPAEYNGIKLCLSGARPISQETGLTWIKNEILNGAPLGLRSVGKVRESDLLTSYVDFLFSLFTKGAFNRSYQGRELIVAIDAGNGMGGHTVPAVMSRISAELHPIFFELDGTFPNHEANPIEPENLKDLQKLVLEKKADIGLAFDGDADRCFLVDETGELVSPSALTALIAERELKKNPGAAVIYNLICSRTVPNVIEENGGKAIRSRVGHSFIKKLMAEHEAVFGGEHSGHFYFKDFWRADSGMLAALHAIAALLDSNLKLSELLAKYNRYFLSGEINTRVVDQQSAIKRIKERYQASTEPLKFDELDGLTVAASDWWFNVRPSNTEPLLRLNVEANTREEMERIKASVLELMNLQ
jgi:phosphomannomutase